MKTRNLSKILRIVLLTSWVAMPIAMRAQAAFAILAGFDGNDGANPWAGLIQAADGDFYGTTGYGGTNNDGTVFKVTPEGKLTTLHSFDGMDGLFPVAPLVQARNGKFYGTTSGGGANGKGTFFKINRGGELTTIYNFETNGSTSVGLVQGADGDFYGTTSYGGASSACGTSGCGTVFKITDRGTLTILHSFDFVDGANPHAGLIQGRDGNLYGTTLDGGAVNPTACFYGCGTVFKVTPAGQLTTLHSFDGTDGSEPNAPLVQARSGKFYGTTLGGGADPYCIVYNGCGTVFEITPSGKLTTIYSFESAGNSGNFLSYFAVAGLVQGTDGNFYGTTPYGGASSACDNALAPDGCGTIFKITDRGTLTTLYSFGSDDTANPFDGLVQGTDGSFYGTTWVGGGPDGVCEPGCGTVFRISVGLGR